MHTNSRRRRPAARMVRDAARHAVGHPLAVERLEDRALFAVTGLNNATWTQIGTGLTGGSSLPGTQLAAGPVTGIAVSPSDVNTFYVATRFGGIYKTVNGGTSYTTNTTNLPAQNIGAIAVAPSNANVVYAGTGNGDQQADSTYGQGVLKSVNGGATWDLIATAQFARQSFARIVVDPADANTVYATVQDGQQYGVTATPGTAASGGTATKPSGIYKSIDGGATWANTTAAISTSDNWADLQVSPASPNTLYATTQNATNGQGGIYRTTDGGTNWFSTGSFALTPNDLVISPGDASSGLSQTTSQNYGRISLAISPTDPNVVYASVAGFYSPTFPGVTAGGAGLISIPDPAQPGLNLLVEPGYVLSTTDGGANWTHLDNAPVFSAQGQNYNAIIVDQADPTTFYLGGAPVPKAIQDITVTGTNPAVTGTNANAGELYRATANGGAYADVTLGTNGTSGPGQDVAAFAYDANNRLLVGTDQGVFRLDSGTAGAVAWTNLNGNLNAAATRAVALVPSAADAVLTANGLNGAARLNGATATQTAAQLQQLGTLDVVADPTNANVVYATTTDPYAYIYKSTDGGQTFNPSANGIPVNPRPGPTPDPAFPLPDFAQAAYRQLAIDADDPKRLILGVNNFLVESIDAGANWAPVFQFPTGTTVSAVSIGNHGAATLGQPSTRFVYFSLNDGRTFQTNDNFATIAEVELPPYASVQAAANAAGQTLPVPGPPIERLAVDPTNSTTAFAVVGGFRTTTDAGNAAATGGHVYMTTNAGVLAPTDPRAVIATANGVTLGDWTDITSNLPNVPVHDIVILPTGVNGFTRTLYLATDRGVYVSYNDGNVWSQPGTGLPNVPVYSLAVDPATGVLVAGTHGRGVWELSTAFPGAVVSGQVFDDVNGTGVANPSLPGAAASLVELRTPGADGVIGTADDTTVATQTTGPTGQYAFTNLAAQTYYVHFNAPATYYLSPVLTAPVVPAPTPDQTAGLVGYAPAPTRGANADPATGNTGPLVISTAGTVNPTVAPDVNAGAYQKTVIASDPTVTQVPGVNSTATFTVSISPLNQFTTVTVPYTTADVPAAVATATVPASAASVAGTDYVAQTGTLTFAPGQTTQTVTITILGGTAPALTKLVHLNLTAPAGFVTPDTTNTVTVLNGVFPTATILPGAITRDPLADGIVSVPVNLSQPAPFPTSVDVSTVAGSAGLTTDVYDANYTLYFAPGATQAIARFRITGGTNPQANKQFTAALINPVGVLAVRTAASSNALVTIVSNTPPTVSAADAQVTPAAAGIDALTFTVSLASTTAQTVTVDYATVNGTAVAGTDYTPVTGTLTFKPGQVSQTVTVPVARRAVPAGSATLGLALSNPSAGFALPANPVATGTIVNVGTVAVPTDARGRVVYTDVLGQRVTVNVRGPGSAELIYAGASPATASFTSLSLTGTTAATTVTVAVSGRGQTSFDAVDVNGALRAFIAPTVNLTNATFAVTGGVNQVSLGYLSAATLTLGGSTGSVALAFNRVADTSITSTVPIRSLVARAYVNTDGVQDTITAPAVNGRRVRGGIGATIVQTA